MVFNGAQYDTTFLRAKLQELVGDVRLSDPPASGQHRPLFIATAATEGNWNAHHVFGNYVRRADSSVTAPLINDCTVWQACRATSAAPTYFAPKQIDTNGTKFVDGGVFANNPINVAVREARAVFGHDVKFRAIGDVLGLVSTQCASASQHSDDYLRSATPDMLAAYTRVTVMSEDDRIDVGDAKALELQSQII